MEKTYTINSDIRNVCIAEKIVDSLTTENNIDPSIYGNVLLSLHEALYNAIIHGNKSDINKLIKIFIRILNNELLIKVSDQGCGFNYNEILDPTTPQNLEKLTGRGIFIIKNLADNMYFSNNGATIEIIFKIS